jgi:hypothetical protein
MRHEPGCCLGQAAQCFFDLLSTGASGYKISLRCLTVTQNTATAILAVLMIGRI